MSEESISEGTRTEQAQGTGPAATADSPASEAGAPPPTPEERLAGLERALSEAQALAREREQALARLQTEAQEKDKTLAALAERAKLAAARYRQAALAAAPEVPEELIQGETVEEIDAALARARRLVEDVRKRLGARAGEGPRTPAGAPVRSAPDLSGLTAREKIAQGLARRE